MEFQDRTIECIDCHESFVFTAGEQEFYDRKGFKEVPKRCKPCRERRKMKRDGGAGPSDDYGNRFAVGAGASDRGGGNLRGGYAAGGNGIGAQRELFDATCAACGAPARVPFRPVAGRPVYCRDCYQNRQTGGY